jgi:hypothetical protein
MISPVAAWWRDETRREEERSGLGGHGVAEGSTPATGVGRRRGLGLARQWESFSGVPRYTSWRWHMKVSVQESLYGSLRARSGRLPERSEF